MVNLIPTERIEKSIYLIHKQKVMIDVDLAILYNVETRILNRAVSRNRDRFPKDFMFRLTQDEFKIIKSYFGDTKSWGGRRNTPYVFTEQGVAMLSSILRSKRSVQVNIEIMRAFVKLRQIMSTHKGLVGKINQMERKYDKQFKIVFDVIQELMKPPQKERKAIGFLK